MIKKIALDHFYPVTIIGTDKVDVVLAVVVVVVLTFAIASPPIIGVVIWGGVIIITGECGVGDALFNMGLEDVVVGGFVVKVDHLMGCDAWGWGNLEWAEAGIDGFGWGILGGEEEWVGLALLDPDKVLVGVNTGGLARGGLWWVVVVMVVVGGKG